MSLMMSISITLAKMKSKQVFLTHTSSPKIQA